MKRELPVYAAPWGKYVLIRDGVLRDLERTNAFIINPGPDYVATGEVVLVGSDSVPLRADPENGAVSGGVGRPGLPVETNDGSVEKQGSTAPHGAIGQTVDAPRAGGGISVAQAMLELQRVLPPLAPIPVNLVLGAVAPGGPRVILHDTPIWLPCLSRELDAAGAPLSGPHAWFSSPGGSMYCPACRAGKPLVVTGPSAAIAMIREAIAAGEMERAYDLVRIVQSPARDQLLREAADETVDLTSDAVVPSAAEVTPAPAIPPAGISSSPAAPRSSAGDKLASGDSAGRALSSDASLQSLEGATPDTPAPESSGSGSLGDDGSPRALPPRDAKATAAPADAPSPTGFIPSDNPKDEAGDFTRPPRPRFATLEEWKEYAAERSAIRQYGLEDWNTPGARERADAFARELAGPPPKRAA